ncbi:MAG: hypothetical protein R2747_06540 [Pyrinomonadaceae bacterium]
MKTFSSRQTIPAVAVILIGLLGVFGLSRYIEVRKPPVPAGYQDEDLAFQGSKLKGFTLGMNGLMADLYWMESLQYLGRKFADHPDKKINVDDLREFDPKLLYPLLDNATDFDPQYLGVYQYGAVVLPAIDPDLAIRIVKKGIANNPEHWQLYHQLGYIYWRLGDYQKSAEAYTEGSKLPGATPIMRAMAAKMRTDGGSRDTARAIYREMLEGSVDEQTRQNARIHLVKLDALDQLDAINGVLKNYLQANSRCPGDLREVLPALSKIQPPNGKDFQIDGEKNPVDPTGAPYLLDRENCAAGIDPVKTKLPPN